MERDCLSERARMFSEQNELGTKKSCSDNEVFLSTDILHHVLEFFVSKSSPIDGQSLRSASLVCRHWKDAVYSSSLWSAIIGTSLEPNKDSIRRSLQLRETMDLDGATRESFIGFIKVGRAFRDRICDSTSFRVQERATGKRCILSVANDNTKNPEVLREMFKAHYVLGDNFLQTCKDRESNQDWHHRLPIGICTWNGRVLRWYEDFEELTPKLTSRSSILTSTENKRNLERNILPRSSSAMIEQLVMDQSIAYLLSLEKNSGPLDSSRLHVRRDCWATIVDWILEIVECFNLDDKTAFLAMALFDRFISVNNLTVKMTHYQVVAGACLLIASKCQMRAIRANDISFCADNWFNVDQLNDTEDYILQKLRWKLAYPTTLDFVNSYAQVLGLANDSMSLMMMRYIAELALQSSVYLAYKPSMIAACATVVARFCVQDYEIWTEALELETSYSFQDLADCTTELSRLLDEVRSTMPDLIMISKRYRKVSRRNVAHFGSPVLPSFATLTAYHERVSGPHPSLS